MGSDLSSTTSVLSYIAELTPKLSCAICLKILFEPSTTICGHSFCRNCLRSAIYKSGQSCPICKRWIRNGESCTLNIALWDTIQHLFPREVEERKAIDALNSPRNFCAQPCGESLAAECLRVAILGTCIGAVAGAICGILQRKACRMC